MPTTKATPRVVMALLVMSLAGCTNLAYSIGPKDCAPVYGNWCGENYPITGFRPRAVDNWDRACRTHDLCYDSGAPRDRCDAEFVRELEALSYRQTAPMAMHNAHSWFRTDGWLWARSGLGQELWAMGADCEGGDGYAATFVCQTAYGACAYVAPGFHGSPCHCGGVVGVVVEQ